MIEQLLLHGSTIYPIYTNMTNDEHGSNVGIIEYKDKFIVNMRAITYIPRIWTTDNHSSENYIGYFNENNYIQTKRLPWKDGGHVVWDIYKGREDVRFVVWNDKLYGYATRTDIREGKGCIEIMEFDDNLDIVNSIFVDNIIDIEKNWMSVPDQPFTFVYWNNPLTLIKVDPETGAVEQQFKDVSLGDVRGSTPLMKYNGKYITLVHGGSDNGYMESFVTYDKDFSNAQIGPWFKMNPQGYTEFITGMIQYKDYIYISMTIHDIVPLILKIPIKVFDAWYNNILEYIPDRITNPDNIIYNYLKHGNYKRTLELLSISQSIDYYTLFIWMLIHEKNGMYPEAIVLQNCLNKLNDFTDSADKYYLLSILYKLLDQPYQEYLYKAKQCGIPSSFFNRFFNEHFIK